MNDKKTMSRDCSIRVLRDGDVSDALIAAAFGLSRSSVHRRFGPRPKREPSRIASPVGEGNVPDRLKTWRKARGMSMADAAGAIGVDTMSWYAWEKNRVSCSLLGVLLRLLAEVDAREKIPYDDTISA